MKIGLIFTKLPSNTETFFLNKIRGLRKQGHEVFLFGQTDSENKKKYVIPHPNLDKNFIFRFLKVTLTVLMFFFTKPKITFSFLRLETNDGCPFFYSLENLFLNSHILKKKLDWVHFSYCNVAIRRENVAKSIGAKMSISLRGYDISIYPLKNIGCYQKLWVKVDKVHSISNDLLCTAKNQGLGEKKSYMIINPAIDVTHFTLKINTKKKNNKEINFLTVSRLHWKKGLDYTLEAMFLLKRKGLNFKYTIIGEGLEFERLMVTCNQLELSRNVRFLGHVEHNKLNPFYSNADIYLQYSIQEGFCNSVLEAQSMGLICVASDAEGLKENIIDGKTGYIVEKRNPSKLANKIHDITEQKNSSLEDIRLRATSRVKKEFNLKSQSDLFNKFYKI